jgi:hypothetical protein
VGWGGLLFGVMFLYFFFWFGSIDFSGQSKCFVVFAKIWRFELKTACRKQATFPVNQFVWSVIYFCRSESGL